MSDVSGEMGGGLCQTCQVRWVVGCVRYVCQVRWVVGCVRQMCQTWCHVGSAVGEVLFRLQLGMSYVICVRMFFSQSIPRKL